MSLVDTADDGSTRRRLVPTVVSAVAIASSAATTTAGAAVVVATGALAAEAIRAIDWLIAARLEWHLRLLAALATGDAEHLALSTIATATAATAVTATAGATAAIAFRALDGTTTLTAPRLVIEALLLVEGLVLRAKDEGCAAIDTG
jgi:hypothetical protein